ncbi:MAG: hypothetical protein NWQ54_09755, partial [Paraglaciecola sp.]|nr:hypothetical protein [Paraglaciecola sp.]
PVSQLPEGTSDNTKAVIALNELAPSKEVVKAKKIGYLEALREVFDSTKFSKEMGKHGIKMSSFSANSKELIFSIVNRNPSGGIPRKK